MTNFITKLNMRWNVSNGNRVLKQESHTLKNAPLVKPILILFFLLGSFCFGMSKTEAQTVTKPTAVLVNLSGKPGISKEQVAPLMLDEITGTVNVYLDGKILQWWSKADGSGVIFILNVTSVEDAKAIMEALPLGKSGVVDLQYTPLVPLQPLKILLNHVQNK